ncbi:WD40 repeat [Cinnamomum micranthum f. kanehirae]|uniref:WD40 repeat n=1 Tax=Cinnamomum micranthum f. kanehirae TaxID=337451 RepID=A0A3S3PSK7_9MAGN|nr:WD40 repeat [Cinnamomum micranthum f. kanehirae]
MKYVLLLLLLPLVNLRLLEMFGREAVVVCSDKNISSVISIWDLESGEDIIHIPTFASPPHGLLMQWKLPNRAHWAYCLHEGRIISLRGAPSGNIYAWEVSSGKLLKIWHAHHTSISCLALSGDDSLLISGADDGFIRVWTMISVLDMADCQPHGYFPRFHSWSQHGSSITGLLSASAGTVLISSSLDGNCKVWDLVEGRLLQKHVFSTAVTAIVLDPGEQLIFSGCEDGRIYVHALDIGLQEIPPVVAEDESKVLSGHKESITALSFSLSRLWLISASKDCTVCLWDVSSCQVTRKFNHEKGNLRSSRQITNLLVIPLSSLSVMESQRSSAQLCVSTVSSLEKAPQLTKASEGTITLLPTYCSFEDHHGSTAFSKLKFAEPTNSRLGDGEFMNVCFKYAQGWRTPEAMQMKVETNVEYRLWAMSMTKNITAMNKQLRSLWLDLVQRRLAPD